MKIQWKLREKIVTLILALSLIPLVLAVAYSINKASDLLENNAREYMKAKVENFGNIANLRCDSTKGNLDIIRKQLIKNIEKELIEQAKKEKYFETGYLVIHESNGLCVSHPDPNLVNSMELYNKFAFVRDALKQKQGYHEYTYNGVKKIGFLVYNKDMDWILWGSVPETEVLAKASSFNVKLWIFVAAIAIIVLISGIFFGNRIAKKASEISMKMKDIAEGEADLSARLPVLTKDEMGEIATEFNRFMENIEEVISKIKHAALHVDSATQEVSSGAQGLSQSTQEQASAVEEVAATIEEMSSSIKQNASNSQQGMDKTKDTQKALEENTAISQRVSDSMQDISASSKKIDSIVSTVNDVAFQTNLLALNAAVEAARAGEHGKGFAVVAEEVRALAQRSADAAKQIKGLIEDTVNKINTGDENVKKSGESMETIISHITDLTQTIEEIAASSAEQANGVDELNRAISQIDSTTQQNASTVEELASTADSLNTEARDLALTVERFKVSQTIHETKHPGQEKTGTAAPAPVPEATTVFDDDFEEF
ncbi:MAG: methyl-accepting chemotaxis protein [Thermodesulfobacteriota bacterium]|nr:methyl-accepting chemotaxis protein [Thermodesulfobacteriota bacterium]